MGRAQRLEAEGENHSPLAAAQARFDEPCRFVGIGHQLCHVVSDINRLQLLGHGLDAAHQLTQITQILVIGQQHLPAVMAIYVLPAIHRQSIFQATSADGHHVVHGSDELTNLIELT